MSSLGKRIVQRCHPEGIPWPASLLYNAISQSRIFRRQYETVAADIARQCPGGRILDIGTGPGWLLLALRSAAPAVEPVGVDISAAMVAAARKNMERAGCAAAIEIREAAADALPFADSDFDLVVSTGSLHHWKQPVRALDEVYRVLKPGRSALMYDLVKKMPAEVVQQVRREFGALRTALLWLHSFEEPFYSPEEMVALTATTRFRSGTTGFVGALCCLTLRKGGG